MGDSRPEVTFPYVARALAPFGLAYLHVIEPRVVGNVSDDEAPPIAAGSLRPLFGGPVIAAGGFNAASADAMEADPEWQVYRRIALEEDTLVDMENQILKPVPFFVPR